MKRIGLVILTLAFCVAIYAQNEAGTIIYENGEITVRADRIQVSRGYDERYDPHMVFIKDKYERPDWFEELVPQQYICGYIVEHTLYFPRHGLFLVKDKFGYKLVLTWKGISYDKVQSDQMHISRKLAAKLAQSCLDTVQYATVEPDDYSSGCIYDGVYIYAVTPDHYAVHWSNVIPDALWKEQIYRFEDHNPKRFCYTLFPKANENSSRITLSYEPFWSKGSNLYIPAVTDIDEGAFRLLTSLRNITLETADPIACPEKAFDESAYENAVLRVPRGWSQKQAAKVGPAWGKFKKVRYY